MNWNARKTVKAITNRITKIKENYLQLPLTKKKYIEIEHINTESGYSTYLEQ